MSSPKDSSSGSTFWHVPGPSSKYHKREYTRPPAKHHARFSTPEADLARSIASSHQGRSNSSLSQFTSLVRSHTAPMERDGPLTPLRSPHHTSYLPHDSPFSDYFTDEARSISHKSSYDMPPPEVQRVLLRLNNLGAQVLRQRTTGNAFESIGEKLDELERSLGGSDRSPRTHRMSDSGFVDDDNLSQSYHASPQVDGGRFQDFTSPTPNVRTKVPLEEEDEEEQAYQINRDRILTEAQAVLERVSKANIDLRERFEEMRELNDQHAFQVEESTREALTLRSENESLKSTLAFDHSELLFLKLQLKALEVQAGEGDEDETEQEHDKRLVLEDAIDQWKSDWDDVDARQRGRRVKHRVMSSTPSALVRRREDGKSPDEEGDWKLDMTKKSKGRVQSITIRRFSQYGMDGTNDEREEENEEGGNEGHGSMRSSPDNSVTQSEPDLDFKVKEENNSHQEVQVDKGTQTDDFPSSPDFTEQLLTAMASHSCQTETEVATTPEHKRSSIFTVFQMEDSKPAEHHVSKITTVFEEPAVSQPENIKSAQQHLSKVRTVFEESDSTGQQAQDNSINQDQTTNTKNDLEPANEEDERSEDERVVRKKSAWAELMSSLTEFAGMAER
ncbi:hypothetical protein B9Z65_8070 [Elsinoe australis]|uniref:Uncharacterized protein n=1 Tax=Elsinoe australis TaxID=40998 RepID=A0A2P7YW02_9PEZI|nr:hypothetical protein B9Z65_8070 [Elsinoe australis]